MIQSHGKKDKHFVQHIVCVYQKYKEISPIYIEITETQFYYCFTTGWPFMHAIARSKNKATYTACGKTMINWSLRDLFLNYQSASRAMVSTVQQENSLNITLRCYKI